MQNTESKNFNADVFQSPDVLRRSPNLPTTFWGLSKIQQGGFVASRRAEVQVPCRQTTLLHQAELCSCLVRWPVAGGREGRIFFWENSRGSRAAANAFAVNDGNIAFRIRLESAGYDVFDMAAQQRNNLAIPAWHSHVMQAEHEDVRWLWTSW